MLPDLLLPFAFLALLPFAAGKRLIPGWSESLTTPLGNFSFSFNGSAYEAEFVLHHRQVRFAEFVSDRGCAPGFVPAVYPEGVNVSHFWELELELSQRQCWLNGIRAWEPSHRGTFDEERVIVHSKYWWVFANEEKEISADLWALDAPSSISEKVAVAVDHDGLRDYDRSDSLSQCCMRPRLQIPKLTATADECNGVCSTEAKIAVVSLVFFACVIATVILSIQHYNNNRAC